MSAADVNPSTSYISISETISFKSSEPSKKLLILDLNGTLLWRPKRKSKKGPGAKRPNHVRPYMSTFCSYLFHDSVRMWLDVMVWSSAQPDNVDSMVTKCFGESKSNLKAVWARDTLGLNRKQYNRKVQTLKDLEKPWKKLDLPFAHTATSTLLMDDSPLKTRLQPYNHLCVPEYAKNLWHRDRQVYKKKRSAFMGYDRTLLAAIGILEDVKYQTNVVGWLRSGGLWADHDPLSEDANFVNDRPESSGAGIDRDNSPEQKPLWFEHEPCFDYWVGKGKEAVARLKIPLTPGFTTS